MQLQLFLLFEVLHLLGGVWDDGVGPGFPASGAHLAVLVRVLERLHQPQGLVHGPAHGEVVHGDLPQDSLVVNNEQTSQSVPVLLEVDSVV